MAKEQCIGHRSRPPTGKKNNFLVGAQCNVQGECGIGATRPVVKQLSAVLFIKH